MFLNRIRLVLATSAAAFLVAACGGGGSSASAPTNFTVVPGDTEVTITWDQEAGVQYWLFYAPASSISVDNWKNIPGAAAKVGYNNDKGIVSPYVLTGLTNGTTYAFTMNGRVDGGKGGPGTASVAVVPRLAGEIWNAGGSFGAATMRGITYGIASGASTYSYVAVGDTGNIYASDDYSGFKALAWTAKRTGSGALNAVLYTLSKFIAVGEGGSVLYSTDIATWTAGTSSTTKNLNAVASSGSVAVAVGQDGTIIRSTDGQTWTAATSVPAGTGHLNGVSYAGSGLWVAVGANCTVLTSSDGNTWTAQSVASSACSGVALTGVSSVGTTSGSTTTYTYVSVGAGGKILYSTDGSTWNAASSNTSADLTAVMASTRFIAVGTGGTIRISDDGITWRAPTTLPSACTLGGLYGLVKANNITTAVGDAGTNVCASVYSY